MKKFGLTFMLFCFILCSIAQVPSSVPTNGLVGWWSFTGNAKDDSGNGNNGTVNGPSLTTDRWNCPNRAYLFNENEITMSNTGSVFSPNKFSISAWFNTKYSTSKYITVFSNFSLGSFGIGGSFGIFGYWIGLKGNKACFYLANGSNTEIMSNENFNDGLWHMLTVTYDGTTGKLYVDAQLKNSVAYNIVNPPTTKVYIGSDQQLEHFYGKIDDVGFWNQVLTPQEITNLYQLSGSSASITPLSSTTFCPGGSVTLQANTGSNYTYEWYNNGVLINGANQSSYVATTSGTYTVTVTGSCSSGTASSTVTVLSSGDPSCSTPSCSATASNSGPQCEGSTIQLNASGGGTYSWSGPNSYSSSAQNPTIPNASISHSGVYTVTIDVGGCLATASTTVVVNPSPVITAGTPVSICSGSSTTLTASGGTTYTWSPSSGLGSTNTATVNASPATSTNYIVTGTSTSGCTATSSVLVTVNPLPVLSGNNASVCEGGTVNLNVSGASVYAWSPSVNLSASSGSNVVFTAGNTTTYTVTGANANNCTNTLLITVNVVPGITVNAGNDQIQCFGTPITLSASGATSYTWSGGVTNGQSFTPPVGSTIYTVTGTSASGCTDNDEVLVTVNPLPVLSGNDVSVCEGGTANLNVSGASAYLWSPSVNLSASTGSNVVFTAGNKTTYTVTGSDANNCTNTLLITVNVVPGITVNAGNDQIQCFGTPITLSASGAISYTWSGGVTNGQPFTPPVGSTIYTVTGTSASGCTDNDEVLVTVNPLPVLSGNDASVCEGGTANLNVSGASAYLWSPSVNLSASSGSNVVFTAGNTTTYTVTGSDANNCTNTLLITVNVVPGITVNAGNDQIQCFGTPITLSASGATSYTWSGGVTNGQSFTPPVGSTIYTVTGTSASGCTDNDEVLVTVNPLPVLSGNDVSVCEGGTANLNVSGASAYLWSPSVNLSASSGSKVVFTAGNTTTYTVTGANANNCTNTLLITVNVVPGITVNAGNDQIQCFGTPITLSASGATNYTWSGGITNGQSFTPPIGSTIYTVTGTNASGCTATDDVLVVVESPPTVAFSSDVTTGCAPLTVTFKNTGSSGNECIWLIGSNTLKGCDSVVFTIENEGCVDVSLTVTSAGGCVSTLSAPDFICAEPQPIASFVPSNSQLTEMDAFVGFINETVNANTYFWDFGDGTATSTEENPTHDYQGLETGAYLVTLIATSSLGCTDTSQRYITISEELIFYMPNSFTPNNDEYNQTFKPVFTSGFDPFDFNMKIFNRWGETLFETNDASIGWDGSYGAYGSYVLAQDGLYTWKIEFKSNMNDDRKMIIGHVALMR